MGPNIEALLLGLVIFLTFFWTLSTGVGLIVGESLSRSALYSSAISGVFLLVLIPVVGLLSLF